MRTLSGLFLLLFLGAVATAQQPLLETTPLRIETAGGTYDLTVELARTPNEQAQGLMFRQQMAADAGMLFLYPDPRIITMWMRNTLLPLDMVFADGDGRVSHIVERTVPLSEKTISSRTPAKAVLELNAGTVARLGIKPGDRLVHPLLNGG